MVTMEKWCTNQQVTNVGVIFCCSNLLVGTPEAVCPPVNSKNKNKNKKLTKEGKHRRWCQWLAGLIDGDGCFLEESKQGYTSLEITVSSKDEAILSQIQNKYGGSLKPRAGLNAVRYRLHNKEGILHLCLDVNGFIRHPIRFAQFEKVCDKLSLEVKSPDTLHAKHGWFAGMFDADGCITLNLSHNDCVVSFANENPQITISVTQKYKEIVNVFFMVFGGSVYLDKSQNGYWTWAVQSKSDILTMIDYFKGFPCRKNSRRQKMFMVPKVYILLQLKAHLT
jgi:hypothetical protein